MTTSLAPRGGRGRGRSDALLTQRGSRSGLKLKHNAQDPSAIDQITTKQFRPPSNHAQSAPHSRRAHSSSPAHAAHSKTSPRTSRSSTSPPRGETRRIAGLSRVGGSFQKQMSGTYQTLKKDREKERKQAIRDGSLADPDKPTSLANAITPVGTCQDMCPQFERVERIVQLMVDGCERKTTPTGATEPCEEKMVKRFRRSAAGYDEQLPSDIRPPLVLQKTLDYLIDDVVGGSQPLAKVHKFVWDRTRGIRNDFSIQQVTKADDIRIAIDCFERIARFHILSLHQLSQPDLNNEDFDHHQEREQLNNTLLSLMYYYDDSRNKLVSPNEAEFRAYCIIFEIQDQRPDLEDRIQQWPRSLLRDPQVRTALRIYAAAGNTSDDQGPLRPRASFAVAQANSGFFWAIIQSSAVSYTMACVAETYFNLVRSATLEAIWKSYKGKRAGPSRLEDWVMKDLTAALGFDSEAQTQTYVEEYGFRVSKKDNGPAYIDLGSVSGKNLSDSNPRRTQMFSNRLVESKRYSRPFCAVINGITSAEAQARGVIDAASMPSSSLLRNPQSLFLTGESDNEDEMPQITREQADSKQNPPMPRKGELKPFQTSVTDNAMARDSSSGPETTPTMYSTADFQGTYRDQVMSTEEPSSAPFTFFPSSSTGTCTGASLKAGATIARGVPVTTASEASIVVPAAINTQSDLNPSHSDSNITTSGRKLKPAKAVDEHQQSDSVSSLSTFQAPFDGPRAHLKSVVQFPKYSFENKNLSNEDATIQAPTASHHDNTSSSRRTFSQPRIVEDVQSTNAASSQIEFHSDRQSASIKPQSPTSIFLQNPKAEPMNQAPRSVESLLTASEANTLPRSGFFKSKLVSKNLVGRDNLNPVGLGSSMTASPLSETDRGGPDPSAASGMAVRQEQQTDSRGSASRNDHEENSACATQRPKVPKSDVNWGDNWLGDSEPPDIACPQPLAAPTNVLLRLEERNKALKSLSTTLVLCGGGLLQQFIEHTLEPMIAQATKKVTDERSWQRANECRSFLLGKKYVENWKKNTWSLALLRKAKERRRKFANSMRQLSEIRQTPSTRPSARTVPQADRIENEMSTVPSPSRILLEVKSTPLVSSSSLKGPSSPAKKRKYGGQSPGAHVNPPERRSDDLHRRSSTADIVRPSQTPFSNAHSTPNGILQAPTRSAMIGKTDNTRTDYFRLKALGLDPDTPTVPFTGNKRQRLRQSPECTERLAQLETLRTKDTKALPTITNISQLRSMQNSERKQSEVADENGSDESLLARSRKLRETMSENIAWFQSKATTREGDPSAGAQPSASETPMQKKLGELQTTTSRSEQRLRGTGAHGLLPKIWERNPLWRDAKGNIIMHYNPKKSRPPSPSSVGSRAAMSTKANSARVPEMAGSKTVQTTYNQSETNRRATGSSVKMRLSSDMNALDSAHFDEAWRWLDAFYPTGWT